MSRIRSKNTAIERKMKILLKKYKIRFIQHPKIFGSPDFIIGTKTIIFCDGDFWHGYDYKNKKKPTKKFWRNKIEGNMKRDRHVSRKLRNENYSVIRLWEHDIEKKPEICIRRIIRFMR